MKDQDQQALEGLCSNQLFSQLLKLFYQRIVALQGCVSFYCTAKWVSYMYTQSPSFLGFLPILIATEHWEGFLSFRAGSHELSVSCVVSTECVCVRQSQAPHALLSVAFEAAHVAFLHLELVDIAGTLTGVTGGNHLGQGPFQPRPDFSAPGAC